MSFLGLSSYGAYWQGNWANYDTSKVEKELRYLRNYFDSIRIYAGWPTSTIQTYVQDMVLRAMDHGFHTIYSFAEKENLTPELWTEHRNAVLEKAVWAQANGVHELMITNEGELKLSGWTRSEYYAAVKELCTDVKQTYTAGEVSAACSQGANGIHITEWHEAGIGDLLISFNVYDSLANFQTMTTNISNYFGTRAQLSEFNKHLGFTNVTEANYTIDLLARIAHLKTLSIGKCYIFTWEFPEGDNWSFKKVDGKFHPAWWSCIENKNVYFNVGAGNIATARERGLTSYRFPHKNRHDNGSIIQGEWSDDDLDYFLNTLSGSAYYGDCINGQCNRDGV